jgi:hypothetical protein
MVQNNSLGSWAFILGVLIAIIAGLAAGSLDVTTQGYIGVVLVVLGLVVGFLNIGAKEVTDFLIAAIALVAVGAANLGTIPMIGAYLASMVLFIAAFVAPAALIVALKAIYNTARTPAA